MDSSASRSNEFTFRRNPNVSESNSRTVNDIKPSKQRRKLLRIAAPETHQPAIIIDKNGKVISMNRNEFNKSTTKELGDLYTKFRKYQDALKNINSEKSFRKIINNIANDAEFRVAMEENPGLLRQEMLNAANRAGLLGKNRKELVKGMVFKKGGILKGQKGL
jgi:predicted nuclease of restriction endonuclease-like RecB superfamily